MGQNQQILTSTYNELNNRCESCFKSIIGKEYKGRIFWKYNALLFLSRHYPIKHLVAI